MSVSNPKTGDEQLSGRRGAPSVRIGGSLLLGHLQEHVTYDIFQIAVDYVLHGYNTKSVGRSANMLIYET